MKYTGVFLAIILSVSVLYGSTLKNGFIHDDHGQVEKNTYIQNVMFLPKVFTSCIWESAVGNCKDTYYYRPLQNLSYMITYQLSPHPWMFHLVNLIYFAADVGLTYILVLLLTGEMPLALLTAGIFLIHPLNTETVNWVATVPELLFVMFTLLSTIYFVQYRKKKKSADLRRLLVFYALGVLAKEPAVFLPFVFLVLDFVYFKRKFREMFRWDALRPYVYSVVFFLGYLIVRFNVLGGLGADPYYKLSIGQRLYIFVDLFRAYFWKLLFPYPLNLFYTFHPEYSVAQPSFIAGMLLLAGFTGLLVWAVIKGRKALSFALVWYIVFLAPNLIFINSIGENLFAERHVFASTIGFALLVSTVIRSLWRKTGLPKILSGVVFLLIAVISFVYINQRNRVWVNDETIYADTLNKSPDADLIRYNLAYLYDQSGKGDKAKEQYGVIVKRGSWRGLPKVFNNLGNIVRKEGSLTSASEYYQKAIAADPVHVESYNNLGAMALENGDILTSLLYLCRANRINPAFGDAVNNLDRLTSVIQGMDEKNFGILYHELLTNGTFKQSNGNNPISYVNRDCTGGDSCLVTFANKNTAKVFPFTFFIAGETTNGQIIRPRRFGIRQATGDMVLDIDKKWESAESEYTFPTCEGTYYRVTSPAQ